QILLVRDATGNEATCTAQVTVEDNIAPEALCAGSLEVQLDAFGNANITANDIDAGSNDACGIASLSIDQTSFDCSTIGDNTVTLTVTDVNGNVSDCTTVVTVLDGVAPTAVCQDITVQLDADGEATLLPADIDGGSADNCSVESLSILGSPAD
ncbi:hypothetical protein O3Q51_18420, partial [Cryomorphaceae bacterium 1068]|nr:hypothetical protein [Cryomorphaceae bacterium 1068]